MKIDLINILNNSGAKMPFDVEIAFGAVSFGGVDYVFENPVKVKGVFENISGVITLTAHVTGAAAVPCSRCMSAVEIPVSYDIDETLSSAQGDDCVQLCGSVLDLKETALAAFFCNAGTKYLCKPDCKGICPVCGVDKNKTQCACNACDIDPRLSALNDLFK